MPFNGLPLSASIARTEYSCPNSWWDSEIKNKSVTADERTHLIGNVIVTPIGWNYIS
jgi:hypothetical protein